MAIGVGALLLIAAVVVAIVFIVRARNVDDYHYRALPVLGTACLWVSHRLADFIIAGMEEHLYSNEGNPGKNPAYQL